MKSGADRKKSIQGECKRGRTIAREDRKLESIVSQIHVYLTEEEIERIGKEAQIEAASYFMLIADNK